jgi:peptide/nickel transport system substrate-binding protein
VIGSERLPARVIGLIGAITFFAVGCTSEPPGSAGTPAEPASATMVVGLASEPDSLNVYLARSASSLLVANRILPRLYEEIMPAPGRDYVLEPQLARTAGTFEEQGRLLRVPLRDDLSWSDGQPVVCEDVRFTHQVQTDPELGWRGASIKRHINEVRCPDSHEVVFRFDTVYPEQRMDVNDLHVLPRSLERIPIASWREVDWSEELPTAGPYRVAESVPGERLVLERNPDFPVERPGNVQRIVFRVVPDSLSRATQLRAGDLHLVDSVPPDAARRIENEERLRLLRLPAWHYVYVGWNTVDPGRYREYREAREEACAEEGREPCPDDPAEVARLAREHPHPLLGDARVRRALTLAVDRRAIVDGVLEGEGTVPASPILPPLAEHDPDLDPWGHDPDEARRLLTEAGFEDTDDDGILERDGRPFRLNLIHHAGNRLRRDAAIMLQRDLGKLGVAVELEPVDGSAFYSRLSARRHDAWLARWRVSARVDMTEMLHAQACGAQGLNFGSWSDPEADRIALEARETLDPDERARLWHRWERIFHREQPYTVLFRAHHLVGASARLKGLETMLTNDVLNDVQSWVLAEARQGE